MIRLFRDEGDITITNFDDTCALAEFMKLQSMDKFFFLPAIDEMNMRGIQIPDVKWKDKNFDFVRINNVQIQVPLSSFHAHEIASKNNAFAFVTLLEKGIYYHQQDRFQDHQCFEYVGKRKEMNQDVNPHTFISQFVKRKFGSDPFECIY